MAMTIDEFVSKIDKLRRQYPFDAETALKKGAKSMTKALDKASPKGKRDHRNKLHKSWKSKIVGFRADSLRADIRSTSPHFHLVNRGFNRVNPHNGARLPSSAKDRANIGFMEKAVKDNFPRIKREMAEEFYKKVRDKF